MPHLLAEGGWVIWVIVASSAVALGVFAERLLQFHRDQIDSTQFLNGVRNVLKRDNIVEALAICDATPGPVPRLEEKLNLLATIAQIAPLLGLLGTVLGFITVFRAVQDAGLNAHVADLSSGIWKALICTAAGLAVSIPSYAGYNYLAGRVNTIVLDMEQVSSEILNIVSAPGAEPPAARPA